MHHVCFKADGLWGEGDMDERRMHANIATKQARTPRTHYRTSWSEPETIHMPESMSAVPMLLFTTM